MIGEREDILNELSYGTLVMREYKIADNEINAFYDSTDNLVFVLDNTITPKKPNVLLVINPDGDKKWDEILSNEYDVDLENIRPKQDNKYQKLDIEYSGLSIYENLIKAYVDGDDLADHLTQLNILRDSAARHSAMMRLNVANDIITKTNATIVKTKESIIRLQERLKTLRVKLNSEKRNIGRVSTKQSASKILKIESQIEAVNEKLKRAKKRLESAQRRLEAATVDAELASSLLNQPALEIKQTPKTKAVAVAPKREIQKVEEPVVDEDDELDDEIGDNYDDSDYDNNDEDDVMPKEQKTNDDNSNDEVKPLFDEDPEILNEDIAFKPISFDTPVIQNTNVPEEIKEEPDFSEDFSESDTETEKQPFENNNIPHFEPVEEEPKLDWLTSSDDSDDEHNTDMPDFEPPVEQYNSDEEEKSDSVLDSITPLNTEPVVPETNMMPEQSTNNMATLNNDVRPVSPFAGQAVETKPVINTYSDEPVVEPVKERSRPSFLYYLLLLILIILSVFTLWFYQKNIGFSTPILMEQTSENPDVPTQILKPTITVVNDNTAVTPEEVQPIVEDAPVAEPEPIPNETEIQEPEDVVEQIDDSETQMMEEPFIEPEPSEPVIMGNVPANYIAPQFEYVEEEQPQLTLEEAEAKVNKPAYGAGSKYDEMFIPEQDVVYVDQQYDQQPESEGYLLPPPETPIMAATSETFYNYPEDQQDFYEYDDEEFYGDGFYDEEEAMYQAEQNNMYYSE